MTLRPVAGMQRGVLIAAVSQQATSEGRLALTSLARQWFGTEGLHKLRLGSQQRLHR